MKKTTWVSGVAALAVALSVAIAAQTSQPSSSTSQASKDTVTVTGCLQPESSAPGAAASTAGEEFILANAQPAGSRSGSASPGSSATGTTGTSSATTSTAGSSYILEGDSTELMKHVGHQIEVTGRLDNSSASSGATAPAGSSSSRRASQKLRVSSVKMIGMTCGSK